MAYLKINGVEITNLVEYDDLLSTQDGDDVYKRQQLELK